MRSKTSAQEVAESLAKLHRVPICEGCDVLRGANICAAKHFGEKHRVLFDRNLKNMLTTHVDLGCKPCPVDELLKSLRKDRFAAIAAMF